MISRVFPEDYTNGNHGINGKNALARQTIDSKNISMISSKQTQKVDHQKYNFGLYALKFYRNEFRSSVHDPNKKNIDIKHEHFKPCKMAKAIEDVSSNKNSKIISFSKQNSIHHGEFGHMKRPSCINKYGKNEVVLRQRRMKRMAPVPPTRVRSEFNSNFRICNNLKGIMISEC